MHPLATLLACCLLWVAHACAAGPEMMNVQVGPRPYTLVEAMRPGALRERLEARSCRESAFRTTAFSIAHRGAPMLYPEHTRESYVAAARMGAGIIECDVTFTRDRQLVCRHAQNDLHRTTDILLRPSLAARCARPFTPARFDAAGDLLSPADAECRTSDITLAEFKTLSARMDRVDPAARSVEEYLRTEDPASFPGTGGTLLSHAESIALLRQLGVDMIPELKRPVVAMPFGDFSQRDFARAMIAEYRAAGITPGDVWPQSFSLDDVLFWKSAEADFGRQAVYLDDAKTRAELPTAAELRELASKGLRIWAPPIWALVSVEGGRPVASRTARDARAAGLELITWSLERPVRLPAGTPHAVAAQLHALSHAGATMEVLDVLGRDIGVKGVFSDWPGTVTYYANCMDL